jgi:chorismate mutase
MFRRIFGFGKRKNNVTPATISSVSGGAVGLEDFPCTSEESLNGSVVPLHGSQNAIRKKNSAEIFNDAVEKLIDKLESINTNLDQQVQQNQHLVQRMEGLPDMLATMPKAVEEQRQAFARVAELLVQKVDRDEKVAEELAGIHEKVAVATEIQSKMGDNFGKFSDTLDRLDQDTVSQTEWLQQISRTFLASERYMKYTLSKQQARFYWIFGVSIGICFLAIVGLVIGIVLMVNM